MNPFIEINGVRFPYPKRGLQLVTSTVVDSARNIDGEVVGQKVCRDLYKINQCEWPVLTADQWSQMLSILDEFFVYVKFPDQVRNQWITLKMYPGDRTAEPYWLDETTGLPRQYINCKVNLIDCGSEDNIPPARPQYKLQNKSVTPSRSPLVVTADGGYYGLNEVRVSAVPEAPKPKLQSKSVKPGASSLSVTPDPGYDGLSQVTVEPALTDTATVTPTTSKQVIFPREGFYALERVDVEPIPADYHRQVIKPVEMSMSDFVPAPSDETQYKGYLDVDMGLKSGEKIGIAFAKPFNLDANNNDSLYFFTDKLNAVSSPLPGYVRIITPREKLSSTARFKLLVLAVLE